MFASWGRGRRPADQVGRAPGDGPVRRTRVLVVDDDAVIRAHIATTLSLEGFEVFEAADGDSALDTVTATQPDVVAVDSDMPAMSGWEVAAALRTNRATAGVRTVVLSTQAPGSGHVVLPAGVDACLRKPFDSHELVTAIRRLATPPRRRRF